MICASSVKLFRTAETGTRVFAYLTNWVSEDRYAANGIEATKDSFCSKNAL